MNIVGIYKITNKVNGKSYIGQSINIKQRWYEHTIALNKNKHSNSYLQYAWNKYGESNFTFEILEECKSEELDKKEIYWISFYNTYNRDKGYNRTLGGDGNRVFNEEIVKEACELFNSEKYSINEITEILGCDIKALRRRLIFGNSIGLCNYNSKTTNTLKVICLTNNKVFDSIDEAEKYYNIFGITACCKKKFNYIGKDSNGNPLVWMYYREYLKIGKELAEKYYQEKLNIIFGYDYRFVCLNTRKVFDNNEDIFKITNLKQVQSIRENCLDNTTFAGIDKITKEHLVWCYYKDYIVMSEDDIQKKLKKGQTYSCEKPVVCLNNLERFDSSKFASEKYSIDKELIKKCCRGESNTGGINPDNPREIFTWAYEEDYLKMTEEEIKIKIELTRYRYSNPQKMKKVICINNHYIFISQREAGKWANINNPSNIGYNIRKSNGICGKHPETNEKLRWMFYDDYIKKFGTDGLIEYQAV